MLGGARLTNEAQYAWAKLAKGVIGTDNVDAQLGDGLDPELVLGLPRATIDDACRPGGTVLLMGPDPKEELGTLYLRLRHAIVNDNVTLIEVTPCATGLSHLAKHSLRPSPGTTATVVAALVVAATAGRDDADDTRADRAQRASIQQRLKQSGDSHQRRMARSLHGDEIRWAAELAGVNHLEIEAAAQTLTQAADGLTVILGRPSLAEPAAEVEQAAADLATLLPARFLPALRRGNVHGALEAGLAPGLLPGRARLADAYPEHGTLPPEDEPVSELDEADATPGAGDGGPSAEAWPRIPTATGLDACGILEAAAAGEIDVLLLVGADPLNDFVDRDLAYRGLRGAAFVAAVDLFVNDSSSLAAEAVLASAGPTECDGTFTNLEGRVSLMSRKVTPPGTARPDWMIAAELAERLEPGAGLDSPQAIRAEMASVSEFHRPLAEEALAADPVEGVLLARPSVSPAGGWRRGRPAGGGRQPAGRTDSTTGPAGRDGPSESVPTDGGLRLVASRTMYDDGVMLRHCPSSRGLASPASARVNPAEFARLGLAPGAAVRVSSGRGHIDAVLASDGGVPEGSLAVGWLAPGAPVNALLTAGDAVTVVKVEAR